MRDPETGPHSRVDTLREERPESNRWVWWFGVACAVAFLSVAAIGSVIVVQQSERPDDTPAQLSAAREPKPSASPTPRESLTPAPTTSPSADSFPVDPRCWEARDIAEDKGCQLAVKDRTKFVPRYLTNQTALAKAHPIVKLANTGRAANSLARHGLLVCWMVDQPEEDWSLDDIQSAFFLWFHRHPFVVPNDDQDAAANNVLSIAVQEICPSLAEEFEGKGGPKAELIKG